MTKFKSLKWFFIFIVFIFLFNNCKTDSKYPYKKIQIKKLFEFGSDEGDDNYIFHDPHHLDVDSIGNIYVLDTGNARIQKFSPAGKYIATIGKKGEGPGEFSQFIFTFYIDNRDIIWVVDRANFRISKFKSSGEYLGSLPIKFDALKILVNSKGDIMLKIMDRTRTNLFVILNSKGKSLKKFGKVQTFDNPYIFVQMNYGQVTLNQHDQIFHSFSSPYVIQIYGANGDLLNEFTRELPYKVSIPTVDTSKGYAQFKNYKWVSFAISVDSHGYILNLFSNKPENTEIGDAIDIFDSSGKLMQTISLDTPTRSMVLKDDKLYTISFADFYKVRIFEIERSK
ncbi:MAG: 6-bladed beta-propeller [Acidobacteriota bacterium]